MIAVVMAGGEGTRLRPLTLNRPKPMVSLVDRPVIQHTIELLKMHGITDIVITVQYLAHIIQDYYGDGSAFGVRIRYSLEEMPLGTAGSVKHAEEWLTEPFLVISGDALTDFDLTAIIDQHHASGALATVTLTRVANPLDYGVVITDERGRITKLLEKPSWGEVFSDTVNTGIYVIDPLVLAGIERGKATDWARDVFPRMLRKGEALYGTVAEGYWTDVGTIDEYMRACGDYLAGKVHLPRHGINVGNGIWVEGDAEIAPDAHLHGPLYIGHGVKIKPGAMINGPAVIRDYSIIDSLAHVDRSIVWRNSYIGERAELRGAIVLRQCNIRARAMVLEGAVIGDGVQIGAGAVVQPEVKIWPSKEVDEGATVTTSIIWGNQGRRVLFGRNGITGLVNIELTPEMCARLGAAYGATLPRGTTVTINRDAHYSPRMLKRAIVAGLPSAGINVVDLQSVPIPVARYFTQASGAAGGVHVRIAPGDNRIAELKFFGQDGLDITTTAERKIENTFFREDYRRAYLDEIGRIRYAEQVDESYRRAVLSRLTPLSGSAPFALVVDYANTSVSQTLAPLLRHLAIDVVELNVNVDERMVFQTSGEQDAALARLSAITPAVGARLGVRVDGGGERLTLVDDRGRRVAPLRALALLTALVLRAEPGSTVAVPVSAPRIFEQIAARYGGKLQRTRATPAALTETAARQRDLALLGDGAGHYIFPRFYPMPDAMFATAYLATLLAAQNVRLSDLLAEIPPFHLWQTRVGCRWESKGRLMRVLNERFGDRNQSQVEGIKIGLEHDDWVLILPDPDGPYVHVIAEAANDETAHAIADRYAVLVSELQHPD
jgi:mannose-1-phosphate guanylyltransferase/phosphomannomutase